MNRILLAALVGGAAAAVAVVVMTALGVGGTARRRAPAAAAAGAAAVTSSIRRPVPKAQAAQLAPSPPRLVGATCAVCAVDLMVATDAKACERCRAPMHRTCAVRHACEG